MLTFLIVCFILFFVLPRVAMLLFKWWYRRKVRSVFEQAQKQYGGGAPNEQQPPQPQPGKRKRIDPEVGEYVEFEEISVTETSEDGEVTVTETEEKIEDAVWEDLPK